MSLAPNMTLISEVMPVGRRDFQLVDATILNPNNANPLVDGEWLEMASASYSLQRGSGEAASISWPVFSLRGQYDTQAISKTTVLWLNDYEVLTTICDATTNSPVPGSFLVVKSVTIGGLSKRAVAVPSGAGQHFIVGIVTKVPGGGKLQFAHTGYFQITI